MKTFLPKLIPAIAAAMILTPLAVRADIISMSATYTIAENDPDIHNVAGGTFNNEVQMGLGVDGLPLLNTAAFGCMSNCFTNTPFPTDVTGSGELTWWSPALNSHITQTGTGTITLPYGNGNFYPPNGTGGNDANGLQAAVFATTLTVPTTESISFNVGADDVAFVYLDGNVVCDLGGIHGNSPGTCTSGTLDAGSHSLELFYADLEQTGAALTFGVTTTGVTGSPTPEPSTRAMMLTAALAGFGMVRFGIARRSRKA